MSERLVIFANPISGSGRGGAIAERLSTLLSQDGFDVTMLTDPPKTLHLADDPRIVGADCAVVIGGDGTVRAVVSAMIDQLPDNAIPPILVVPMGTANLLGGHLGMKWNERTLDDLVRRAIHRRRVIRIDTASANGQPFLIVGGVGLDAAVVHEIDRLRTGPIAGRHKYLLPAFRSLSQEPFKALTVTVDGQTLVKDARGMAFVGNIPEYGTGFPILPHARPDDGLLDVCVIPCQTFNQAILVFLMAAAGQHLGVEQVRYAKGKEILIESTPQAPVQIDGEPAGFTPVDIRLLPIKLPFIVP